MAQASANSVLMGENGNTVKFFSLILKETGAKMEQLSFHTRIDSLVSDSLEFVSLIAEIENEFSMKIPIAFLTEAETLGDLYGKVRDYLSARKLA